MFGYVRVAVPDLKVREYRYYQAIYCGLCRALGQCTGNGSRMTLSYDFVFMAAVQMALNGTAPQMEYRRCIPHPFRKRPSVRVNDELKNCAYAAGILTGLKCLDDVRDEKGPGKLRARIRCRMTRKMYRKSGKAHPEEEQTAAGILAQVAGLESRREATVDQHADLCGQLLASVFHIGLTNGSTIIAKEIGYHTGRLVDLLDAVDDWSEDARTGKYNPLIALYPDRPSGDKDVLDNLKLAMYGELAAMERAVDLIDMNGNPDLKNILYNILHAGLPGVIEDVAAGRFNAKLKPGKGVSANHE